MPALGLSYAAGESLTLRPEATAGIVRAAIEAGARLVSHIADLADAAKINRRQ